ncbi:MAG: hypothetical protein L6R40_001807 [Gallowayella cf. fulva]|nr:MAG: hypothetical protein L6R40_001807 [Xanthomendoza cf. fulva]
MPKMSETSSSSSAPSNGPIQNQGVQEITVAESEAAADCLALAFADDEVAMYFVKTDDTGDWSKEEKWKMHVRIMHSIVEAHCLKGLALTIGPNYDCVALWMPPGKNMDDRLIMFRSGMWVINQKLLSEGQSRFQEEFMPLLHQTKEEVLGSLDNNSWYLVYIGTKPDSRGKGYAKQLIEYVTRQADDQGLVCYLESSNEVNPKFYRKLGFETEKKIHLIRGPKPVEMEVMVRKPIPKMSSSEVPAEYRAARASETN